MESILKYFAAEGRVILKAPVTFGIALVLLVGLVWTALSWDFSSRIANLDSRISLRDDQIADYKSKLNGATPDEAKKRLDALESELKALTPRRLTGDQKNKIAQALKGTTGMLYLAQDMAATDATGLTRDLSVAFIEAGWQTILPSIFGPPQIPPTGIALLVADSGSLKPAEITVKRALESARIEFDIQNDPRPPSPLHPDVGLLITTRLK